jgi:glycosyltransferase involved in cell wall biosynthesis
MNILHVNSNFNQSTIYKNMIHSFNSMNNVEGRVFFPVKHNSQLKGYENKDFIDVVPCLNRFSSYLFFSRNRLLSKVAESKYNLREYNIILAYSLFSNGYLAMTMSKMYRIPYIVIVQNTDVNLYLKKMLHLRKIGINILLNAAQVIFISSTYKELVLDKYIPLKYKEQFLSKTSVIPFGVDDYWINNKKNHLYMKQGRKLRLLYVGKINKNKNISLTIEACKILKTEGYDIEFTIIGTVEDSQYATPLLKNDFVNHHSFMDHNQLIKYYQSSDIFIMPSYRESFGLVYVEAMSQGTPVIYTKGQGFDGQFENKVIGVSINATSILEMVSAIKYIESNYSLLSKNCYQYVEKFSWSNITQGYVDVINSKVN